MVACMPFIDELAYINVHRGTESISRRISMSHLKHIRVIAPLTAFLIVITILATARGVLVHAAPSSPVLVSGPSPYASCVNAGEPGFALG